MISDIQENLFSYESIISGRSDVDVQNLYKLLVDNKKIPYDLNSSCEFHTRSEDSHCPLTPIVESLSKDMELAYFKVNGEKISRDHCWGHIHEKNMSTRIHNHYPADASGVFYVSTPKGSGKIVFPRSKKFDWKLGSELKNVTYEPKEGMFLLFPGYLNHYATRNKSENLRVSISFNFCLERTLNFDKFTYF